MEILRRGAKRLRFELRKGELDAFRVYLAELEAARPRLRLTALTDPEAVQRRHFLEPLALLAALEDLGVLGADVIDIGSGAGFPGLPIKIVRPQLRLTLLEANGRRAAFLEGLVGRLGLAGVAVVNGRAEEVAHSPGHREAYDLALARAVAPLPVLVELALPFLRVGGALAAPKGSAARREIAEAAAALAACGGAVAYVGALAVPAAGTPPTLVVIRKESPTPARFPRRAGIPAKHPLRY
ncbi:MAG TPA: 16S rRNA (guanine(527)-N(7))-methyltransferase RsmG [Dehalococcoidia bacterium]|nr:16S rRNA (guanine(527)-N(7))-methyltransferase RsmG [Dehalococcoidia bacterium]